MKHKPERLRKQIIKNVQTLSNIYGLDSNITIVIKANIVVYGIVGKGKTFWSRDNHLHLSTIARYHKSITIGFLSDLSNEIASIVK